MTDEFNIYILLRWSTFLATSWVEWKFIVDKVNPSRLRYFKHKSFSSFIICAKCNVWIFHPFTCATSHCVHLLTLLKINIVCHSSVCFGFTFTHRGGFKTCFRISTIEIFSKLQPLHSQGYLRYLMIFLPFRQTLPNSKNYSGWWCKGKNDKTKNKQQTEVEEKCAQP